MGIVCEDDDRLFANFGLELTINGKCVYLFLCVKWLYCFCRRILCFLCLRVKTKNRMWQLLRLVPCSVAPLTPLKKVFMCLKPTLTLDTEIMFSLLFFHIIRGVNVSVLVLCLWCLCFIGSLSNGYACCFEDMLGLENK